jgi:opacity protein-like surface antigen
MKKLYIISAILVFGILNASAQDEPINPTKFNFGLKAGYSSVILKIKVDDISVSDDLSGFYFGIFGELSLSENFGLQPELLYSTYSQNGESSGVLQLPVLMKYLPHERLAIVAGPQFDYLLDEEDSGGLNQFGAGIALGASFDITENLIIDARYSFGLTNRIDGDLEGLEGLDVKNYFNYFFIGLGYRF